MCAHAVLAVVVTGSKVEWRVAFEAAWSVRERWESIVNIDYLFKQMCQNDMED